MKKLNSLLLGLLIISMISFSDALICDKSIPNGCPNQVQPSSTIYINDSTLNVNNSIYWDGHTFSYLANNYYPLSNPFGFFNSTTLPTINLSNYYNTTQSNATYLKLDQTTPQTTVGTFTFPEVDTPIVGVQESINIGTSLVAHYKMNDINGNTLTDSAGTNTGTGVYTPTVSGNPPTLNSAASFDGSGDYASLTTPIQNTNQTVSFWAKINTLGGYQPIFGDSTGVGDYPVLFSLSENAIFIPDALGAGVNGQIQWDYIFDKNWHFYTFTQVGITLHAYVDNVEIPFSYGSQTTLADGMSPIDLIGRDVNNGWFFGGSLDDVRIYNRALSVGEVRAIYNGGKGTESETNAITTEHITLVNDLFNFDKGIVAPSGSFANGVTDTYNDGIDTMITFTGGIATGISTAFDERLMQNISYINEINSKDYLTPITFNWNKDGLKQFPNPIPKMTNQIGYKASDVARFYPECVVSKTETLTTKPVQYQSYDRNCLNIKLGQETISLKDRLNIIDKENTILKDCAKEKDYTSYQGCVLK